MTLSCTGVSADPARRSSCGKEHDRIAHELDVVLECVQLLISQVRVARIELESGNEYPQRSVASDYCGERRRKRVRLELFEVDGECVVCARHGGRYAR